MCCHLLEHTLDVCVCVHSRSGEAPVTAEKGALALLDMAAATGAASSATGVLSFATRARAVGAVFKLLPADVVDKIYPYVTGAWSHSHVCVPAMLR